MSKIKVIKVQHTTNDVEEEIDHNYGYSLGGTKKTTRRKDVKFTEILYLKRGELFTKTVNGSWTMEDVKKVEK